MESDSLPRSPVIHDVGLPVYGSTFWFNYTIMRGPMTTLIIKRPNDVCVCLPNLQSDSTSKLSHTMSNHKKDTIRIPKPDPVQTPDLSAVRVEKPFSEEQEGQFRAWAMAQHNLGFPATQQELQKLASQVYQQNGATEALNKSWVISFLDQYPEVVLISGTSPMRWSKILRLKGETQMAHRHLRGETFKITVKGNV